MPTFNDSIAELVTTLQNDSALDTLCQTYWGKALTVKRVFRFRTELGSSEFPIVMVTRPSVSLDSTESRHTVHLYYGFLQDDRELAQEQSISFVEALRDAINANKTMNKTVLHAAPNNVEQDEGVNHPVYVGIIKLTMRVAEV